MDAGFNPAARRLVLPGGGGGDSRGGGKCRGACGKGDGEGGRGADLNEYQSAFTTRPKMPRTPDHG